MKVDIFLTGVLELGWLRAQGSSSNQTLNFKTETILEIDEMIIFEM
jgi:hypothetical protein